MLHGEAYAGLERRYFPEDSKSAISLEYISRHSEIWLREFQYPGWPSDKLVLQSDSRRFPRPSAFLPQTCVHIHRQPSRRGNWNRRKSLVVFPPTRPRRSATQILLRRASIHFVRYHFVYHSRILKPLAWYGCVSSVVFRHLYAAPSTSLRISTFPRLVLLPNIAITKISTITR